VVKSSQLISEFMQALQQEINALKKGKGGSMVKVFNGRLLRETSGLFVYVFHLENFLIALDDTPAEIEVAGTKCQCQVVSVRGMEVQIALEKSFGQNVAEAKIWTNLWFLLELLRKKYEEALPSADSKFEISKKLFAGIASERVGGGSEPEYSLSAGESPNQSQKNAIADSFNKSLAVIWGPPGTGKTKTIAKAVQAHLNAGRRVLLASHANTAVDEALEDIAEHLKPTDFYQEGKLIRQGVCHKATLEKDYPLVILDNIAAKLGESLTREKNDLLSEQTKIEGFLNSCKGLMETKTLAEQASKDCDSLKDSLSDVQNKLKNAQNELKDHKNVQKEKRDKLAKAKQAGFLKRTFLGLNPEKLQGEIDRLSVTIDAKNRVVSEQKARYDETKSKLTAKESEIKRLQDKLSKLISEWGVSVEELNSEIEKKENRLEEINTRLGEIDKELDEIQKRALTEARLVATTLTKTFSSKQFPDEPFDILIIDESSMAPLPYIYWAAGRVSSAVTIVGDFLQLPPICVSDDSMARKWLGRSIFDVLGINSVKQATQDEKVSFLDTQYRMAPDIAGIPNKFFYQGFLHNGANTKNIIFEDSIGGSSPLVMVDTTATSPWCSRLSTSGRFNIYHALVSTSIARKLLSESDVDTIGIVTPYRAQARLIQKITKDWDIGGKVRVDTVHRFQGGEEQVIILDCVEGPGVPKWSMLDDQRQDSAARLLLNVALTRAKSKVFLVAHKQHFYSTLNKKSIIVKVIERFSDVGVALSSENLVDNYFASDFEKWASAVIETPDIINEDNSTLFTEKNFWPVFLKDLQSVETNLIIMSPFASLARAGKLMDFFRALSQKGVKVRVYTRPPRQQGGSLSEHAEQVIEQLETIGVEVIQRSNMHQKIAVIDDCIAWEGSLNILSHRDTKEQMRRLEGENAVQEVIRSLDLDKDEKPLYSPRESRSQADDDLCPRCLEKGLESKLVQRMGRYGPFWGCSSFPKCRYTKDIRRRR